MIRKIYKILSVSLVLVMILSCGMCVMGTTLLNLEDTISESYLNLSSKLSLNWTPSNETKGSAGGTYILSANDSSAYGTYELYYADDEGILSEYAPITECSLSSGTAQAQYRGMIDQNVLPVGATKVVASLNGQIKAYADIPAEKRFQPGELLYTHAIFSDIHVFGDESSSLNGYDELPVAIETVQEMGAQFLSVTGDLTKDDGLAALKEALAQYDDYDIHVCSGNHDVGISKGEWTAYWGNEIDYSFAYKGETFIYLSLLTANGYSDEKIEWLAEEMKEAAGGRIYLFMHFPIPGHAGLKPGNYYGFTADSTEDDRIMEFIRQYDNTYVFSGHTHYNFDSQHTYPNMTVTPIEGTNSYTVHVPSIAYPRLSNDWEIFDQSQGFFVEVYEDGIILKGIDFKQDNKLIPVGCYYLESKIKPYYLSEGTTTLYSGQTKNIQILGASYDSAQWSSSNTNVVTVDGQGNITATAPGKAVITATIGEYTLTAQITVKDTPTEVFPTFYIDEKNGKEGNTGLNIGSPLNSLAKAIEIANQSYGSGDTVEFRFIGTTATYNATAHTYTAVLSSADPDVAIPSMQLGALQGDTVIENIKITNWNSDTYISGKNLTIKSSASAGFYADSVWFTSDGATGAQTVTFEQKLDTSHLYISKQWGGATFPDDITLVVDNVNSAIPTLSLGHGDFTNFNGNVNLVFKDMGSLTNLAVIDGANFAKDVQIINSSDVDVSTTTYANLDKIDATKLWILNNQTKDYKDALEVTDTTGIYKVDTTMYSVTATKNGEDTIYTATDGELDLTAGGTGTYTYTVSKKSQSETYYVGANEDYANIVEAINAAETASNLTTGDTLTLNVTSEIEWGDTATPAHEFNLVITSELETAPTVTTTHKTKLGGNTTFGKITLALQPNYAGAELFLNDYDVVFESNSEITAWNGIVVLGDDTTDNSDNGQRFEIKGKLGNLRVRVSDRKSPRNYTGDIDIVVDNIADDTDAVMTFSLEDSSGSATNYQNVNFDIRNAVNPVTITGSKATFAEGKGLQIINSCEATINNEVATATEQNTWIINDKTGVADLITCTSETGKFAVNSDSNIGKVVAIDSSGYKVYADGGYLELDAGEYTVGVECAHIYTDDCDKVCDRDDCGYERADAPHKWQYVCDTECECGETRVAQHSFVNYSDKDAATCEKNATEIASCEYGCGETDEREKNNTALGHSYTDDCDEVCDRDGCGYERVDAPHKWQYVCDTECECGETRDADHVYDKEVVKDKYKVSGATCTKAAVYNKSCVCGAEGTETFTSGKALDHKYDAGKVTKPATCKATGVKTYTCTLCKKATKTYVIAKAAHVNTKTTVKKATTKANGYTLVECKNCGADYKKTTIYKASKIKLSTTEYTYNSKKTRKPTVKVYDSKGKKISSSYYDVKYASGRKKVGKYKVTITFKKSCKNYSGTLKAYFEILPKETKVSKVTAAKKSLKVKIKKQTSQTTGYQIQYSTSKTFKSKYTKSKTVKNKTTSVTLKSLKAKKTYYVRVRTYKTVNGKKYYSDWSKSVKKKTK